MVDAAKHRKRGTQRRVYESETRRPTLTFRVRDELHVKLKASAEARGYSLSEEIEHRLNRSLDAASDHFAELALQLIADNWRAIQSLSRRKMVEDEFTLQACCEAAYRATELLAGVNGVNLHVGLLGSLGSKQINIEAGKQLGHAIVYHRELLHMKDPPDWATPVYEANMVEALAKRVADLKERVAEQPSPASEPAVQPAPSFDPVPDETPVHLTGPVETIPVPGLLPDSIGGKALFDETMGPPRDNDTTPPAPVAPPAPAPAPARRRKLKAGA